MSRDRIRPRPTAGTLADQVRALGSRELDEHGRALGATSSEELAAWCGELAEVVGEYDTLGGGYPARILEREAQLVDLLALELLVVQAYQRAGVLPADELPPPTAELVARMRGAG